MKNILLIDDSRVVLTLFSGVLEAAGYRVLALEDSGDFDPAAVELPDLILIDINMPQFFGDDIADFFREEWGLRIPILLFSGLPEAELQKRVARCGADGYISKDWGVERIVRRIGELVGVPGGSAPTHGEGGVG